MNKQTNIYFTIINADNTCIEKEITEYILSDNNIAKDICNSVDKYKFLINNLSIDSKVVSFMIKIIMNTKIIYNQMFNLKNKDNIVTQISNTVFTYDETLNKFTKLWIYIPKTIFDILDKVVEPIIEQSVEVQIIEQPVEVKQIIEQPVEVKQIIEQPVEVKQISEQPVEVKQIIEQPVEVKQIIEQPVEVKQIIEQPIEVKQIIEQPVEVKQIIEQPVEVKLINEQSIEIKPINELEIHQINEVVLQLINEVVIDEYEDMPPLINFDEQKIITTN